MEYLFNALTVEPLGIVNGSMCVLLGLMSMNVIRRQIKIHNIWKRLTDDIERICTGSNFHSANIE